MIGHPTDSMFTTIYIYLLAWEPSAAHITKRFSHCLPALEPFYRETKFSLLKSTHSTQNHTEHFPRSPEFPNQNLRQTGLGVTEL